MKIEIISSQINNFFLKIIQLKRNEMLIFFSVRGNYYTVTILIRVSLVNVFVDIEIKTKAYVSILDSNTRTKYLSILL